MPVANTAVIITVKSEFHDKIDDVAAACTAVGMKVGSVMKKISSFTGEIKGLDIGRFERIAGVQSVKRSMLSRSDKEWDVHED